MNIVLRLQCHPFDASLPHLDAGDNAFLTFVCTQELPGGSWKLHLHTAPSQPALAKNQSVKADFVNLVAGGLRTPDFNRLKPG
jgi:hypothetical protein